MSVSVNHQAVVFLYSIVGGALIAFIYDILRIKRRALKTGVIAINIEDFIYWIVAAVVMFMVVFKSNDGEVRGYIFIGTVIGVLLYILTLSRLVMGVSLFVIKVVTKVFLILWRIFSYPVKVILKLLSIPADFIFRFIKWLFGKTKRAGKSRLSKIRVWTRVLKNVRKKI